MKRILAAALTSAALLAIPAPAGAATGDEVRRSGDCSIASDWELRVRDEGRTLRVRWRVNSRIQDQTWRLTLSHNGEQIAAATRVLSGEGEATLERRNVPDVRGPDRFDATAQSAPSGETCAASATL